MKRLRLPAALAAAAFAILAGPACEQQSAEIVAAKYLKEKKAAKAEEAAAPEANPDPPAYFKD